jgi:hypothetical protein
MTSSSESRILVGTCSWTDKTLTDETDWYPKRSMTAEERLKFYAARYPIVEADSTYYFPPSRQLAKSIRACERQRPAALPHRDDGGVATLHADAIYRKHGRRGCRPAVCRPVP